MSIPIITVDGGAATGKGAVSQGLAKKLGFHHLDSGVYYRLLALKALRLGVTYDDIPALSAIALHLHPEFSEGKIFLEGEEVSMAIRTEECSVMSSKAGQWGEVRTLILQSLRDYPTPPGVVAEGRDMGTIVFPTASLKFFLICDVGVRAERRHKQLENQGVYVNIATLRQNLEERDERDQNRESAPLKPAADAIIVDTTCCALQETIDNIYQQVCASAVGKALA